MNFTLSHLPRWGLLFILIGVGGAVGFWVQARSRPKIQQPIAFSHRVHVQNPKNPKLKIDCSFCHENYGKGQAAGMPSITTCMPCHSAIKSDSPEIKKLKGYFDQRQEVPWVRLNSLPSHNVFSHQFHVKAGIECAHCHGDVAASETLVADREFTMDYCYSCHVSRQASVDCLVCHK